MAIAVTNDASAFKRSASVPTATAFSIWAWFNFTSATPARFWGPMGIYEGSDGAPTGVKFLQISSAASGSAQLQLIDGNGAAVNLLSVSANTWYFIALTASGTVAGTVNAHIRAITSNSLTSITNAATAPTFTAQRIEWGRDGFTGDFISGSIHAVGAADVALSADELLELSYFHEPQLDGIRSLNVFYPTINSVNTDCTTDMSGNGRNATATVGALSDSPPLLWRSIPAGPPLPAASGGALTGATTLTFTPTGTLTGAGALSGSTTLTFTPTATLTGAGALSGNTTLTFAPSATLTGSGALSGTATITFSPTGTLADAGSGGLVGAATLNFTAVGVLTGTGAMSGATTLTFAPVGVLTDANAQPVADVPVTGGGKRYAFFNDFDAHRYQRERRRRRQKERDEEAREIQNAMDREIAELLRAQDAKDAERAELKRIQALADKYAGHAMAEGVSRRAASAILKAHEERSFNALEQMQRELERMYQEEEAALTVIFDFDD